MKLYPVTVEIKTFITDGEMSGTLSYRMGLFRLPTEEQMPEIMASATSALPDGFRLMSRHEATMHFLRSEKGYHGPTLALPELDEGDEWHDPATANSYAAELFGAVGEEEEQ